MDFLLTTKRLGLRPLQPDDAPYFFQLNEDPEVLRYTGDLPFADVEAARQFLKQYDQYERYACGRFAVLRLSDSAWLGWCGLKYKPEVEQTDIGFRFFRRHWGQGYATEAAEACLAYGLETLGFPTIVGRAMQANHASIRVLEKIGMRFVEGILFEGEAGVLYETPIVPPV